MLNKFHPIQLTYFSFSLIGFVLNIILIIYNRCYGTNNLQEIDPNEKKRESIKRSIMIERRNSNSEQSSARGFAVELSNSNDGTARGIAKSR